MNVSTSGQQQTMHSSRPIDALSPTIHTPRICLAIQCQILHHSYSLHATVSQLTLRSRKAIQAQLSTVLCTFSLRWSNLPTNRLTHSHFLLPSQQLIQVSLASAKVVAMTLCAGLVNSMARKTHPESFFRHSPATRAHHSSLMSLTLHFVLGHSCTKQSFPQQPTVTKLTHAVSKMHVQCLIQVCVEHCAYVPFSYPSFVSSTSLKHGDAQLRVALAIMSGGEPW